MRERITQESFGPEGQRTQVIMLDTRFFRSALQATDDWGAKGKERYVPSRVQMTRRCWGKHNGLG